MVEEDIVMAVRSTWSLKMEVELQPLYSGRAGGSAGHCYVVS